MSIPLNLKNASLKLVEQLLICRPHDAISFTVRYFYDERNGQVNGSPSFSHAIHSLLFLIKKPVQFRSAISTIFCYENSDAKDLVSKSQSGTNTTNPGQSAPSSSSSSSSKNIMKTGGANSSNVDDTMSIQSSSTIADSSRPNTSASESKKSSNDNIAGLVSDINDINLGDNDKGLFSNMNVSNPVNNSSKLFQIARNAIQSVVDTTDVPSPSSSSPHSSPNVHEWLYMMIEKLLNEEIIPQGITYDFDAYIAFIRLYLSLWIVALWVKYCVTHMQSKAHKNDVAFAGIKENAMSSNGEAITKMLINEKDENDLMQLCFETYNSSARDDQSNLRGLCTKIMSRYVKRYILGNNNETSSRQGNWIVS